MKKLTITIAAMLLITSLTACSGSSGSSDSTGVATTEASTSTQAEKTVAESSKVIEPIKDEDLLTIRFPIVKKYVDGPRWQIVENGYTEFFNINDRKFIALTTNQELSVNKPSEVLDALLKTFQQGAETMCGAKDVIKYDIKDTKEMTINGNDYVRYQGYIVGEGSQKKMYNCYFVGYTFICEKDGKNVPCQMIGAVVSDEQEQSDIDEITKYTDAMVYTIRNTRDKQ